MPIKVAVLFSGGKDSTFALYNSLRKGYDVKYLVSMVPENPESYMFHHPNIRLAEALGKSMGIPVIMQKTKGEKEKELEDLQKALRKIRHDIDGVVVGGLASRYQADRIGRICQIMGLKLIAPLWNVEPAKYWKMLLNAGFEIYVVSVSAEGLDSEWLGRKMDWDAFHQLKTLSKKFSFHLAFEGGEAETLVTDAPMYSRKLLIIDAETVWCGDSGTYNIRDYALVNKKALMNLKDSYEKRKAEIKSRLEDFRKAGESEDRKIFEELCFCLCTPQSKATACDEAVRSIVSDNTLYSGSDKEIAVKLKGVRFHNKKAENIVQARELMEKGLKCRLDMNNPLKSREWLVKNVKGLGYKEASHFLRNMGLGKDIAIIDRHILKNLKRLGVIEEIPKSISTKKYMEIERRVRVFSEYAGIPMDELDLLFWSEETGHIFK